ncbi:MAG TPA: Uma2 family endonuclease [Candidatus Acidoferrum sp.]|jgi:Uma2 family endonuclease|nr:Uma2 family endonuclease [Candidatus Acidoferrum sp.]
MRERARGIDTEPYLEWLDGSESLAVIPGALEGIVAMTMAAVIHRDGHTFGSAIPKLHLRINDTPAKRTMLLPDVVFYRGAAIRALDPADRFLPNVPPEIIVEVRSSQEQPGFREEKIRRYLAWGCPLVFDVDPALRSIVVNTRDGTRALQVGDHFSDSVAPWLVFDVDEVFARLELFGL